ncbi:MAG: hypothetical protein JWM93_2442 [Frankiales bacterium]|nr:hypothetical protein [Frankiales bacterium]
MSIDAQLIAQAEKQAVRRRALACLREGRVTVDFVGAHGERVIARVKSSRHDGSYVVDSWPRETGKAWECTCRAGRGCPHIAAVRIVTDHGGDS